LEITENKSALAKQVKGQIASEASLPFLAACSKFTEKLLSSTVAFYHTVTYTTYLVCPLIMISHLHDTTGCTTGLTQTGCQTGLTTMLNEQPLFVQPVVKNRG